MVVYHVIILFCFDILLILSIVWLLIEAQLLTVKKVQFKSEKIKNEIKVVFISDIHYGSYYYKDRLKNLVRKINNLDADIVIIGGDYLSYEKKQGINEEVFNRLFSELKKIKSNHGVITVLGNHDYYLNEKMPMLIDYIEKNKIILLKNTFHQININDNIIILNGVDDLKEGRVDLSKLHSNQDYLNILVSHNPDFYEKYDIPFDIGLSGHTHGGQVTFFGIYSPLTGSGYGQKYVKSINKIRKSIIITTKGIGCSMLPLRFFAVPEIIELIIK